VDAGSEQINGDEENVRYSATTVTTRQWLDADILE
jgi:hypothetical protein